MEEQLIELRRARARRKPTKRARCERRDKILSGIVYVLSIIAIALFIFTLYLKDPAYGATLYPEATTQMSEQEYDEMTRIVNLESHTEDMTGQMAVAEVIFNRKQTKGFKNTIHGVLSQKGQFTTWKMRNKAKVTQMQIDAIEAVIAEEESILTPFVKEGKRIGTVDKRTVPTDYVFFCTPEAYERIGIRYMFNPIKVGGHIFGTKYIGKEE